MKYELRFSKTFQKDFVKLDSTTQSRVLVALEGLKKEPLKQSKKLKNVDAGIYRKRIGDYRLRFDLERKEKLLLLHRIRHRKEVYKK
jgi:mRNA interferase RelE/StbE